jgi:hypothetical protein
MTKQTGVKEQVGQVVAGKILEKLAKLGAAEEHALKHSVAAVQTRHDGSGAGFAQVHTTTKTIPGSVVAEVLTKLGKLGLVRKISVDGQAFIARRGATREELLAAVKLSLGESRYSAYAATTPGRRQRYQDEETSFEMVRVVPLTDPEDEVHYSEREGAMTYEGSVADDPFEAELPTDSETANVPAHGPRELVVTDEVRAKIAHQDRIGQGARNTRRARARYLKTDPAMQQWLARKEMEENVRREERRTFRTGESHITAIAPAMSPEQAFADHHN